ncbi:MAG TPA: pyridoxal 5'-phosphate synthase glutaminase subunit PdxT [Acidimicrobiales bacterium]|nr:pyridoxal 5'-phosphate synthase glutaminase subunit PdxT [Acidimicrobiales bacterium]
MTVGILALQGDVAEHRRALRACGVEPVDVRSGAELDAVDALVIPGGESTTMLKLIDRYDLREGLVKRIEAGMPVLATCAGAIVLAARVSDGEPPLGVLDLTVIRNAYGSQRESFETEVSVDGVGTVAAAFIRAPAFADPGPGVTVLARWDGRPVAVRAGNIVAVAFHTEITGTTDLHRYFVETIVGEH